MIRLLIYITLGIATSFFLFPISLTFIPQSLNTKIILSIFGAIALIYKTVRTERLNVTSGLLGAIAFGFLFSLVCFIATDINSSADYAYATYIFSQAVWLFGAYGLFAFYRILHSEITFKVVTMYLAAVCASQCIFALMIDNIPAFQLFVDTYVVQDKEFFEEINRLYGIGAALDPAGVRFSVTLIMIAALLNHNAEIRDNTPSLIFLLISFIVIALIGSIISRTTSLGLACAVLYFVLFSGIFRTIISQEALKLTTWFVVLVVVAIIISTYLYQTNEAFYKYLRFAFEGFFNWIEKGEWRTDSTDKLNNEMWVWPKDFKTWMIGTGLFDGFVFGTDIGYCRFILYCGLIGFGIFATFFVYLPLHFARENPRYTFMFLLFMALSFMIWIKVATDIFQFYALFFCLDKFVIDTIPSYQHNNNENRVLRPRYV